MVDNFPCISWPMGTWNSGARYRDSAPDCEPCKVSPALTGRRAERVPDGYLVVIGQRIEDGHDCFCPQTARGGVAVKCAQHSSACSGRRGAPEHGHPDSRVFCLYCVASSSVASTMMPRRFSPGVAAARDLAMGRQLWNNKLPQRHWRGWRWRSPKGRELLDVDHATKRGRRQTSEDRKHAGPADASGNSGWQAARMRRDRMDYRIWAQHAVVWDEYGAVYIAQED